MNKKFTKLMAALALLVFMTPSMAGWGQTRDDITLTATSGFGSSYGTNHTFTSSGIGFKDSGVSYNAKGTPVGWAVKQLIQMRKSGSGAGEIYNTTEISTITSLEVTLVTANYDFTVYYGASENPSANGISSSTITPTQGTFSYTDTNGGTSSTTSYTFTFDLSSYDPTYIKILNGSKANYVGSIVINYSSGYTVTFDCDGGQGCPEDMTGIAAGENNFTVPNNTPTKECYTFDNVYLDDNLVEYVPGQTYTITDNLNLTASWTKNKYTVTYYSNNGESGEDVFDDDLNCGSPYSIADDPGFTPPTATPNFVNWNTQADGNGTAYEVGDEITISADVDLYAQWSASARYTVTYDCDGGTSGCPENQMVFDGTQIQLPGAPSKEGYIFVGWMCDADLETYAAGADYTVASDVEFEAQWLEKLAIPTITVAGVSNGTANTYFVTAQVTINQTDGANIYYTTDGTNPTAQSTEYENPFSVTSSCTIKAIAIFEGYANSDVAEQEIIIVQPNEATFTDGVYSEDFASSLGLWYPYSVSDPSIVWSQGTPVTNYTGANINGYTGGDNTDYLISPQLTALNGMIEIGFKTAARYNSSNVMTVKYSTDYDGYSNPTDESFHWTDLGAKISTTTGNSFSSFTTESKTISGLENNAVVYVAFVYTSAYHSAKQYVIKDFTAKQYYPVNYWVNGGSGTMDSEYYPVGETVYVPYPYFHTEDIDDGFIAPEGMAFSTWNTQANGQGTTYDPDGDATFIMGISAVDLYAQWATAYQLTVDNPDNVDIIASCGSESIINGGSTGVAAGKHVYLFADPAEGYEFGNFIVTKAGGGTVEVTYEYDEELQYGIYYFLMPADNVTVSATVAQITTVVDELTRSFIGVTSSSYTDWSGKKSNSTAVYAGKTSGGDNNKTYIQLKSADSNSGIITTTSGGRVKEIAVTWNSSTSDGRTLDVYGKNTPYSEAADLYATSGNTNQGTKLGSIVKGTSTILTITGNYTYIGLRSSSGAMYIDKIEITWDNTYSATTSVAAHTEDAGWCFIASPFSANNSLVATDEDYLPVAMDDDATDLYYYDEPTHMWMNYKQHPNDFTFANGVGYLYANSQDVTLTFAGTSLVANDTKDIDLSYTANAGRLAGWNLVGNPFNCAATLDMDCYILSGTAINTTAQTAGSYTVGPCEGVMVKANEVGQLVTFTKATPGQTPQPNQLQMTVAQQVVTRNGASTGSATVEDNAIVSFNEGNRLEKFAFNADAAKLYIPQNDKEYAIVSAEAQGEMPVNFRAAENGTYTLSIDAENVEMNYLHLIDNMTGMDIDLLQTPSYTFEATTRDYESRFRLVFAGASTGSATDDNFAFFSNGNLIINNDGNATLQVIDLTGRILSSESVNGSVSTTLNATPGVYMLRLINGENVKVQKIVVR